MVSLPESFLEIIGLTVSRVRISYLSLRAVY